MADSMHYVYNASLQHPYPQTYYGSQQPLPASVTMTTYYQSDQSQRKRPKYTRSKTGCMTCRAKKVKCDEEKPDCARCRGSGRECVWPDGGASRKRSSRREARPSHSPSADTRPPTGGSSHYSDHSTSSARQFTPPKTEPVELSLSHPESRRTSTSSDRARLRDRFDDEYHSSQRAQDAQEINVSRHLSSSFSADPNDTQYFAHQHRPQSHSQAAPFEQYAQSMADSYDHPQHLQPHYHHIHSIKIESNQEWQAAMSQHVDPIHPFAVSVSALAASFVPYKVRQYPAMQDYYAATHDSAVGGQVSHQLLPYSYMKYT